MKTAIITSLIVGALTLATMNSAAAETVNTKKLNPWQDCGIGAMVFPSHGIAAAISNIIWDLGTTAVSSNISSQNSCASNQAKTAMFIQATLPVLEQEVAIGEGEYLTAMLELRGCEATSHNAIINAVRNDIAQKSTDNAEALYNVVEDQVATNFVGSCTSA
ncbi:DUF3015 family protein [Colwellia hornerae]|uniref:DUF3015 domain-containing protein n=1 Tax=Colwellia hornerae TaxID=89402 RepID=A0A5C6QEM7_9GAMM|nr:DUF3015 family protein [Colwellia hornerae]TWX59398.1 DUF3015 domain-containing protein [Colwellia hornerae]TWX62768.1 DUF3015 domain-containing protein [Colwellia hornerae]TWX67082.1 DUF3015 domain-containing protein [Colwellia hornerae]